MHSKSVQDLIIENHYLYYRDFPWRHKTKPYEIMIAEFMLQRTKAEQVEKIYTGFLHHYPNADILSTASYEEISSITKHLGLHWRSAHFIDAAKCIVKSYGGKLPQDRDELLKIPGIGDYVSGAILCVCHNRREYVIDSNIARFVNRLYGLNLAGEIRRRKIIKEKVIELFDYDNTRFFLFALLDFNAIVCRPRQPECRRCVLREDCKYNGRQIEQSI